MTDSGGKLTGARRRDTTPLLSPAGRAVAAAAVAVCVTVTALLGAWLAGQTQADWLDAAIDGRLQASLRGHLLVGMVTRLGRAEPVTAMTAALVLACVARRWYRGATLVALSVPAAAAITEYLLKPLIGRLSWGSLSFPSGHATGVFAVAAAVTVLLFARPATRPAARALRLALPLAAFLGATAVAVAVVGVGFHYFTDTVGGAAVGIGTVLATALAIDLIGSGWPRSRERRPEVRPHHAEADAGPPTLPAAHSAGPSGPAGDRITGGSHQHPQ